MTASDASPHDKAISIFRELVGDRANHFSACPHVKRSAENALADGFNEEIARDIVFHMTDWSSDAAFVAAWLLFPERFSDEEVRQGIMEFLVHAPNHVAAAAKLHDFPIQDVFEVGALDGG